jgi:protein-L-isoaspartate O-methyltransferase
MLRDSDPAHGYSRSDRNGSGDRLARQARYHVVALEPGRSMAEIARRNLRAFPLATVEVRTFEAWSPPAESFNAVVAATSFHWVNRSIRVA